MLWTELVRHGVRVDLEVDATRAVERLATAARQDDPYGLVFLDWRMPKLDGLELAADIRSEPAIAATPLAILSGIRIPDEAERLEALQLEAVMEKPISRDALVRCLAAARRRIPIPSVPPAVIAPLKVLLVEDNAINQYVVRRMLEKLGCPADTVANGREAIERLARQSYDVVVMDCQMPVVDGFEATTMIRSGTIAGVDPHVRIVALTASAMPADRAKCLECGMDDFLAKPVNLPELHAALRRTVIH